MPDSAAVEPASRSWLLPVMLLLSFGSGVAALIYEVV
jgi:hypothetical protein